MNNIEGATFIIEDYEQEEPGTIEDALGNEIGDELTERFKDALMGVYNYKYGFKFDWITEAFPEEGYDFLLGLYDDHYDVIVNGKRGPYHGDVISYPLFVEILNRETKPNEVITIEDAAQKLLHSKEAQVDLYDYVRDDIPKVIEMIEKTRDRMRDICNDKGFSCKDNNGEYLPARELAELIW